jgi:hypothetical protein
MSDKALGIIGQRYEDRKTGKSGVLESRDEKYKTLMMKGDDGVSFSVCNSTFRSNWRKVKEDGVDVDQVGTEPVEQEEVNTSVEPEEMSESSEVKQEEEPVNEIEAKREKKRKVKDISEHRKSSPSKSYEGVTNEESIAKFVESIMRTREVEVNNTENAIEIFADKVIVAHIDYNNDGTFKISMLPDLFTFTDWRGKLSTSSIEYKVGATNYLGVTVDTKQSCIPEILDIIEESVKDINVYGYTTEESEEE